jgi:mono/diheme cytochrome c family protein
MYRKPLFLFALLLGALLITACGTPTVAPAPPAPPSPTALAPLSQFTPDLQRGHQLWFDKQCVTCHGPDALGGVGPALASTDISFDRFLGQVRNALPPKPAFSAAELSTEDAYNLYAWLQSLSPRAVRRTPPPAPTLAPGQVLGMTLWTQNGCDRCHGAFAQGSPQAPRLAGISYPYERERALMRRTADRIRSTVQSTSGIPC